MGPPRRPTTAYEKVTFTVAVATWWVGSVESLTRTLNMWVPAATVVGTVPDTSPEELSFKPLGKVVFAFHVRGAVPPSAASWAEYATPLAPAGSLRVETSKPSTSRVKAWVAPVTIPLLAVKVMGKVPVTVGEPLSLPPVNVTPAGRAPDSTIVGAGNPVALGVNEWLKPFVKIALAGEVMTGAEPTVSVKDWVTGVPIPFDAVTVIGKTPFWVDVPESTPVEVRVTPVGRVPVSLSVGAGVPVAVTVNEPRVPLVKVAEAGEVSTGVELEVAEGAPVVRPPPLALLHAVDPMPRATTTVHAAKRSAMAGAYAWGDCRSCSIA